MPKSAPGSDQPAPLVTSPASWMPERITDRARASRLISNSFPELRDQSIRPLAEGWDNSVFTVGEKLAFRFPRRSMAVPGVRREIAVLPALAPLLPLPIPTPIHLGMDDDADQPWPFFGARLLAGDELALLGLPDSERAPLARALGDFLSVLHDSATVAALPATSRRQLRHDPMHRGWPRARITDTRHLLETMARERAWTADARADRLLDAAIELPEPATSAAVLVHGDLHIRHLLADVADGGARATGVIDWGDVCLGDPAIDLAFGYAAFTGNARRMFLEAYGAVDADRELRARALALRLSATLAAYALATEQRELASEAVRGLHRAVS